LYFLKEIAIQVTIAEKDRFQKHLSFMKIQQIFQFQSLDLVLLVIIVLKELLNLLNALLALSIH